MPGHLQHKVAILVAGFPEYILQSKEWIKNNLSSDYILQSEE
jgi:hypothetical protein